MSNMNYGGRKAIWVICGAVVLWTLGARAAVVPPDPDNAALVYYQALLLRPESDTSVSVMLSDVLRGAEPDQQVRQYLRDCQKMLELAEAAAQIPHCNWGIRYSQGHGLSSQLMVELRSLAHLLYADARLVATDGDYRTALNRCLTIRRLAAHIGDDTQLTYALSLAIHGIAGLGIRDVLGSMPPDAHTLTWLQGQLAAVRGAPRSPARALEMDFAIVLEAMRTDTDFLAWFRDQLAENAEDPAEVQNLTDEELLAPAQERYANFLNSALRVMDGEMPYEQKYAELEALTDRLWEESRSDWAAIILALRCGHMLADCYGGQVLQAAGSNALKAAIEIYLAMAETGQLPDTLPDHLPKDPFSGEDFEYETTEDGFVLRCRVKAVNAPRVEQYEFKVQR
jgi:hypothetical protein